MASGIDIRPVILSPSFKALRSWSSCTDSAVGLNESCAAAGLASTNKSANAAHRTLAIDARSIEALRVETELGIWTTPFRFPLLRERRRKPGGDEFASTGR